jgi:hypothetical protein
MKSWRNNITMEAVEYLYLKYGINWKTTTMREYPELGKNHVVIAEILDRVHHCTYWEWNKGLTLFFWRWTPKFRSRAQDGVKVYSQGKLPSY